MFLLVQQKTCCAASPAMSKALCVTCVLNQSQWALIVLTWGWIVPLKLFHIQHNTSLKDINKQFKEGRMSVSQAFVFLYFCYHCSDHCILHRGRQADKHTPTREIFYWKNWKL